MLPSSTASTPSLCPARIESSSSLLANFITTLVGRTLNPLMLLIRVINASANPTLRCSSSLRARLLNGKTAIDFIGGGAGLLVVHQKPTVARTTAIAAADTVNVRRRDHFLIRGNPVSATVLNL